MTKKMNGVSGNLSERQELLKEPLEEPLEEPWLRMTTLVAHCMSDGTVHVLAELLEV